MSRPNTPEIRAWTRTVARPWRWLFTLYALAMTTGTHWPRLAFGPEIPASDKMIHPLAFGGLTFLLWRTKWIRSRWLILILVSLWAVIDELTQGIPGLGRDVSLEDIIASILGVIALSMFLWASAPAGKADYQLSNQSVAHTFDRIFIQRGTWLSLIAIGALALSIITIVWSMGDPDRTSTTILAAALATPCLASHFIYRRVKRERIKMQTERACFHCNISCAAFAPTDSFPSACPNCDGPLCAHQWTDRPGIPLRSMLRYTKGALLLQIIGMLAMAAVALTLLILRDSGDASTLWPMFIWLFDLIAIVPDNLIVVIDIVLVISVSAIGARLYIVQTARYYDQALRCRNCGYDLRATPADSTGAGVCGECGTSFTRLADRIDSSVKDSDSTPAHD